MDWRQRLAQAFEQFWAETVSILPNLLVALAVLASGIAVAALLRRVAIRMTTRIAQLTPLGPRGTVERSLRESGIDDFAAKAVGHAVYWLVLLAFAVVAGETLGLAILSQALGRLVQFLPSVLAAVLVVIMGILLARLARQAASSAAARTGLGRADLLGEAVRLSILAITAVIALDQVGIESTLLILTLAILLGTLVGSLALAFALGARDAVGDAIAVHYVAQRYRPGDRVQVLNLQGRIIEFSRNAVLLETAEGRALVPATEFARSTSILLADA